MSDLFDFGPKLQRFAVMGNPIQHSKSPVIHTAFGEQTGLNIEYTRIQVDPGGFEQAVSGFQANGGSGLNVTVPFKMEAHKLADELSQRAQHAGAVNTLKFSDGKLYGDNTDGAGLLMDITGNLGQDLRGTRVLILGAGGAVRGVVGEFQNHHPEHITVANRTIDRAVALSQQFSAGGSISGCGYRELAGEHFDVIINGTSASLQGKLPELPDGVVDANTTVYDLVYANEPTVFMQWATAQGARIVCDGLGMLVEQAAEAFEVWTGIRPETRAVMEMMRRAA